MNQLSDESLMDRVQGDRIDASGLLYERYKKPLWVYFFNNTGQREVSSDLVHVTFERMIKYRKNYRGEGTFKAWLFSIARNAMKDQWSKQTRNDAQELDDDHNNLIDEDMSTEERIIIRERNDLLKRAIRSLPVEKRELLSMIKLNGMKYSTAAAMYDMNESTLKVKVFRITQELKRFVESAQSNINY